MFRQADVESEMESEMRAHVAFETEELMRAGLSREEAERQAVLAFGGVQQAKEEALEGSAFWWLDTLRRDVRIATRTLVRHPTFAVTATLALALAIAVNTTMFSVIDAMLHPRTGGKNPEQLYSLKYLGNMRVSSANAIDEALAAGGRTYVSYTGAVNTGRSYAIERGELARRAIMAFVRPNFFSVIDISPIEGTLTPVGPQATAGRTLIISDRLREQLFPTGESPIGQSVNVEGQAFTVQGVTTRSVSVPALDADMWTFPPSSGVELPGMVKSRGSIGPRTVQLGANIMRLKPGVSREQAEQELALLSARVAAAAGEQVKGARFDLHPIARQFQASRFHYALIGAALAVLLVACTNLANLQLARGLGRASELAVRSALGASRPQIVAQLSIESGVLALAALTLGILLALAGNELIRATIPPNIGDYVVTPASSWRMVGFAGIAAVFSLALVGLIPAVHVSRVDLNSLIKSRAGTGAQRSNRRTYGILVIAQIALTFPVVCAAVMLSRSASHLAQPDFLTRQYYGFDPTPLVRATLFWRPSEKEGGVAMLPVASDLISRARGIAGVRDAAVVTSRTVLNASVSVTDIDGAIREVPTGNVTYRIVSPSYFRTMGLPMERGRDFQDGGHDIATVLLDRTTGWFLWPRSSPVGRSIKLGARDTGAPWLQVDGVVGDYMSEDARAMRRQVDTLRVNEIVRTMTTLDSVDKKYGALMQLYVRTSGDPQAVATTLRRILRDVTSTPPEVDLYVNAEGIPQRRIVLRFIAGLFMTFGILALGLSSLGVYGIVAQSASDRQREVAVRMSLGASPRDIVHALLREGNVLVLAGLAIGLYVTKETMGWLGSFLNDVDLSDALFFGLLCVALFAAMVIAALLPAIRATRVDPMQVLRAE